MADLPIAVFVSGRGSNVEAILDHIHQGRLNARVVLMISSSAKAGALELAQRYAIPARVMSQTAYPSEQAYANALLQLLAEHGAELVVLAGYLKMIPAAVVTEYRHRMINIHPALLPAFGGKGLYGRHVHEAVLSYGCKVSGATVHMVEVDYDTGTPLIQRCVAVHEDDTADTLAARVLTVEHQILSEAIQLFADGRVIVENGRVRLLAEKKRS